MATRPRLHQPGAMDIVVTISGIVPERIEELAWWLNAREFSVATNLPHEQSLRPHARRVGHVEITAPRKRHVPLEAE